MLHNHALISSLLLEAWYINPAYAETMLPSVIELLEGKQIQNSNTLLHEKPLPSLLDNGFRNVLYASGEPGDGSAFFGNASAGSTAVIPIRGAITKYDGMCSYGVESYMQWVDAAEQSPSVSNIVLLIDSPGGQANSAFMLAQRIANVKKPTLAFVDSGMAASAAYLIGSAADLFYVSTPVDVVGSIGAMITLQDFSARLEGSKTWEVYSRLSTEKNAAFRRLRENNDPTLLQDMLDENVNHFISAVKTNRGDRLVPSAGDPFKGKDYTGAVGLEMGLIDGIGTLPEALTRLSSSEPSKRIKMLSPGAQLTTEHTQTTNNTDMSILSDLKSFIANYKETTPEASAEVTTPAAVVETPETPAATAETPTVSLEARLAALETAHSTQLAAQQAKITELTAANATLMASKPAAAPTAVMVANETVPTPVEAPEVVSFYSETDAEADRIRKGQVA